MKGTLLFNCTFFPMQKVSTPDLTALLQEILLDTKHGYKKFLKLPPKEQAFLLHRMPRSARKHIIIPLKDKALVSLFELLDPDEVNNLLSILPEKRREKVLVELSTQMQEGVGILSQFDPKTAAGLMNLDYIQVEIDDTIAEVIEKFQEHETRRSRLPAIIVTEETELVGYLPGHVLGISKKTEKVKKYLRDIPHISHDADHEEVIKIFKENPHNKVVVLGDLGHILGIIYSDDILRLMEEQKSASLYDFAGVHAEEEVTDGVLKKVHFRYKWLIINLGTAFFAASIVGHFEEIISKYVLLAVYMPIVAGMGGNAATQTLAVVVRGIALGQIELKTAWRNLLHECGAGLINGIINGIIVAAVVLYVNKDPKIALILSFAMVFNLFVAAFFGTLIPLIMQKLGKDPATSATIFITTATDVLGFLAFLGLATMILA